MLPEETIINKATNIQDVNQRICVFAKTSCIDDQLVTLRESLEEKFSSRSYKYIDLANLTFDLDRQHNISLQWKWRRLKARVNKRLVEIKC